MVNITLSIVHDRMYRHVCLLMVRCPEMVLLVQALTNPGFLISFSLH